MTNYAKILWTILVVLIIIQLLMVDEVEGRRKRKRKRCRKCKKNKPNRPPPPPPATNSRCGYTPSSFQTNIIGGTAVAEGSFRWAAAIYIYYIERSGYGFCGGTLITPTTILTAAHCLISNQGFTIKKIKVVIGTNNLQGKSKDYYSVETTIFKIHDNYALRPTYIENDIAYIKIKKDTRKNRVLPVCLPINLNANFKGKKATAIGFGLTDITGTKESNKLMEVGLTVVDQTKCRNMWGNIGVRIIDGHLCATDKKKAICSGDSGGALFIQEKGLTYLIGISSFTPVGCVDVTSVFTRVTELIPWLNTELKLNIKLN